MQVACRVLNTMTRLGMPDATEWRDSRSGNGGACQEQETVPTWGLCPESLSISRSFRPGGWRSPRTRSSLSSPWRRSSARRETML